MKPVAKPDQVGQEQSTYQRMMEIKRPRYMKQQRDRQSERGHVPCQLLAARKISGNLKQGQSGEQHQGTAALPDLERKPALKLRKRDLIARIDRRDDVND